MFERFSADARHVVVQAQANAHRLGHNYIGCEHLLLAIAAADSPAGAALREQGVTPERAEEQIARIIGLGRTGDLLDGIDREALAAIGIDLDAVRARIGAAFGLDALAGPRPARQRLPLRRRLRRKFRRRCSPVTGPGGAAPPAPGSTPPPPGKPPWGHIPFTPRAKKSLQLALREALTRQDNSIGPEHIALALLRLKDGAVPLILARLGVQPEAPREAILDRYRKAS